MKHAYWFVLLSLLAGLRTISQTLQKPFTDTSRWVSFNNSGKLTDSVAVLQTSNGTAMLILQDTAPVYGEVELDIKGRDVQGQSFVGVAFNIRSEQVYETIYFRPFNFRNAQRRDHSIQYSYEPAFPWHVLRENYTGRFESSIESAPAPEDWLHAKLQFSGKTVKVFVNENKLPSLVVDRLAPNSGGKLALWVSAGVEGQFKNVRICHTAPPAYGYDSTRGRYLQVAPQTRLYYEEYGEGEPILLLHGGVYGYIDEFEYFIRELSKTHRVIALATRGHVKSDIGTEPFTWTQRASDAKRLLDHLAIDSAAVIGFSDGGNSAFTLAAHYPEKVTRMLVMGAGDRPKGTRQNVRYSSEELWKNSGQYFEKRLAHMREPQRWEQSLQWLNRLYNEQYVSTETFSRIKCPVLLLSGERDQFASPSALLSAAKNIRHSSLAIIPACDHVVFYCNWPAVWESAKAFFGKK